MRKRIGMKEVDRMKKAVLYVRVSTHRQAEEGISKDAQLARARAWSEGMGYRIAGEYQDNGISGKRADNRPGLQKALDVACKQKAALVVYSLSRLARSTKDALSIAERLDKAGADLVSLSENIDTTSAAGKMVFRMLAVLSEFERDLVSERTSAALAHKRANGYKTGGTVPFGYDVDRKGKLSENPAEQEVVQKIRAQRNHGATLRAIAEGLNGKGYVGKTGRPWSAQTVSGVLKRLM
jgi:site-specific DNA recombinase